MRARTAVLLLLAALLPGGSAASAAAEPPALRVLRTGGLRVETAALLMSGQEGGTIPLAVLAFPLPGEDGRERVAVLLELDGADAAEGQPGSLLHLEVCLYAVISDAPAAAPGQGAGGPGRVAGARMDTVEIDLERLRDDLERSGLKYLGELALPPGEYALRALVRNAATGEVGLRSLPLSVPDFQAAGAVLLPPFFAEPEGSWLLARGSGIPSPPPALSFDALPSARPILAPAGGAAFRLAAWRLGGGEVEVEVRRPGGARVAAFPLRITGREAAGPAGLEVLTASFEPAGLEEGVYELRATAPGAESSFATPFVVLERETGSQVWAALTPRRPGQAPSARAAGAASAPAAEPRGRRVRRIDAGPVRAAYRNALRRLAEGDREGGRDAVLALETGVLQGERPASSEDLAGVELDVARELARGRPAALVPILTLHQVLYRDSVRKGRFLLSTHSREMVFRLIDLYARMAPPPEGRRDAALFLNGLAAEMIWTAPPTLRSRLFQQVLAYDASDLTALLCRAVDAERQGRYAEAVEALDKLLRTHPGESEALLRLGINLARLGKTREAHQRLSEVTGSAATPAAAARTAGGARAGEAEPWQLAVAWQESGRLQIAAGDLEGAERTLRQGLEQLPEDEKLRFQLAWLRDLRQDPRGARDVLAGYKPRPGGGSAARHRYNRLPLERLDQAWAALQAQAVDNLPALAAALGPAAATDIPPSTP